MLMNSHELGQIHMFVNNSVTTKGKTGKRGIDFFNDTKTGETRPFISQTTVLNEFCHTKFFIYYIEILNHTYYKFEQNLNLNKIK